MRRTWTNVKAVLLGVATPLLCGCTQVSQEVREPEAGVNGGFETVKDGLPVNWLVYTPDTVPNSDFDIAFDKSEKAEGRQSLKFTVRACEGIGGWRSPGFAQEYPARPGDVFDVRLAVRNDGTEFGVAISAVSAFGGVDGPGVRTDSTFGEWWHYQWEYAMPEKMERLRLELNVLRPGTLWIDDVRLTRRSGEEVKPL